jgi:peptide/nickel transport system substrate-binding protein
MTKASEILRHRRARRAVGASALCVAVVAALTACSGHRDTGGDRDEGAKGRSGGTLVWAKPAEALTVDPARSSSSSDFQIMAPVYDTLVTVDQLKPVPALAKSWRQTSPVTYVFDIRPGVKFSNGREMTVDDVVGSLRRVMSPDLGSPWAGKLGIKQVAAAGTHQVKVILRSPRSTFIPALANQPASILPMKELRSGAFDPAKAMLGTGPFVVAEHLQDESWTMRRNPYYWGRPAAVDKLLVRIIGDDAARIAALRANTVQVAMFDSPDAVRLLRNATGVKTVVQETTSYYRIDVNAITSVFRDARLRRALALSVDRNKIARAALGGVGRPSAAVAPSFTGVCDATAVPMSNPDVNEARSLVTQAGAKGKTVSIIASTANPTLAPIAQVLKQDLDAAGLNVKILQLDNGEWIKRVYNGKTADFELELSYFGNYADPAMGLSWWDPAITGFSKPWFKDDPGLNKLIGQSETASGAERASAIRQACAAIAAGANIIPLVTKPNIVAYRMDRVNANVQPLEVYQIPLRNIAKFALTGA